MIEPKWQPMETAPRDGSSFVVKQVLEYSGKKREEVMIVRFSEYSNAEGGWWLEEGAVIHYETCNGWWPIPPRGT